MVARATLSILAFYSVLPAQSAGSGTEEGKQIYLGSCSGCHGATGEGSQGPSLLSGRVSRADERVLFRTIKDGLPGTSMPNFPMEDEKVWQVVRFVRSLTAPANSVFTPGDAARGREIFFGAGGCSGCHMIGGKGGHPGPDLSNIGAERTLPQLRQSLLEPSARIAPGYRPVTARQKNSSARIEGVAKNYNNYSAQIIDSSGRLHLLNLADLASFEVGSDSLMPPVRPADAADLLAFLAAQAIRNPR